MINLFKIIQETVEYFRDRYSLIKLASGWKNLSTASKLNVSLGIGADYFKDQFNFAFIAFPLFLIFTIISFVVIHKSTEVDAYPGKTISRFFLISYVGSIVFLSFSILYCLLLKGESLTGSGIELIQEMLEKQTKLEKIVELQNVHLVGGFSAQMLGDELLASVEVNPPSATTNLFCKWSIEPKGVFAIDYKENTHCSVLIKSPWKTSSLTPPGWSNAFVEVDVYDSRHTDKEPLLTKSRNFEFNHDGLKIKAIASSATISQDSPVDVSIVHYSHLQSLPEGYECTWNMWGHPVTFVPSSTNNCRGKIFLKPEGSRSRSERFHYSQAEKNNEGRFYINSRVIVDGNRVELGIEEIHLRYLVPEPESCQSNRLHLCTTESSCSSAGGYWRENACNGTAESFHFGTVTSVGRVWMDRNLGAARVAESYCDEKAYGDLYQWGREMDGHEKRSSPTNSTLSLSDRAGHGSFIKAEDSSDWRVPPNTNLWQGVSGVNNPCPAGFRIPTKAEWMTELTSWNSRTLAGAYSSPLKLVVAGYRGHTSGKINQANKRGYYWFSTLEDGNSGGVVYFHSDYAGAMSFDRAAGASVRCIRE